MFSGCKDRMLELSNCDGCTEETSGLNKGGLPFLFVLSLFGMKVSLSAKSIQEYSGSCFSKKYWHNVLKLSA